MLIETDDDSPDITISGGKVKLKSSNGLDKAYVVQLGK